MPGGRGMPTPAQLAGLVCACLLLPASVLVYAQQPGVDARHFSKCQDRVAQGTLLKFAHARSRLHCATDCAKMETCQVAQIRGNNSSGVLECRLLTFVMPSLDCSAWKTEPGTLALVKKDSGCGMGGLKVGTSCLCPKFKYGSDCENIITDCYDGAAQFGGDSNGWGWMQPPTFSEPVWSFCNFDGRLAGVVLRNPGGATVLFNRSWAEYKTGFGDGRNSWWGLENVYKMTQFRAYRLEFSFGFSVYFAGVYHGFRLGDESTSYTITFTSFSNSQNAPSGVGVPPRPFCTYDRDCNKCSAKNQGAGWWYGPNCETGGITYPQDEMWWPGDSGTNYTNPAWASFQLTYVP